MKIQRQRLAQMVPSFIRELWTEAQSTVNRTESHVRLFASRLVEKGAVNQEEAARLINQLHKTLQSDRQENDTGRLDHLLHLLRLPGRAEIDGLGLRVADVQRRIEALESKVVR